MEHKDGALVTGSSTIDELLTYCFPHNLYAAFLKFGPEFMLGKIAEARAEREEQREARRRAGRDAAPADTPSDDAPFDTPTVPVANEEVAAYGAAASLAAVPFAAAA